jgi:alpha-tubulin suppressor-like RCC1 family protein
MTVTSSDVRRMAACVLLLCGCGGTEPNPTQASYVLVSSETGGALPGSTIQLTARAFDSTGQALSGVHFDWATEDGFLATVDANGLVTTLHPGNVAITARVDTVVGGLRLTVLEPVVSAELRGVRAAVVPGGSFRLPSVLRSGTGDSLATTFRDLRWSSSQEAVATVDNDGVVSTLAPGTTTLTLSAETEGVSASVTLVVATLQYRTAQDGGPITCGLTTAGRVYCWGVPGSGYVGLQPDGVELLNTTPWPVNTDLVFDSLTVGGGYACALTAGGNPWCWGVNDHGTLGDGTATWRLTPQPVAGDLTLKAIATGAGYTCGLRVDGGTSCWGWNDWGNLGTGDRESSRLPRESAAGIQFRTISLSPTVQSGGPHTCGMSVDGEGYCWGANEYGQLATYPRTQISHSPTTILSPTPLVDVQSGGQHGCGLTGDGTVLCWGDGHGDALGDRVLQYPGIDSIPAPVPDAPPFTMIRAGLYRTCGLTAGGDVYCWGDLFGKKPVRIQIPEPLTRVDVSSGRFCGMSVGGVAYCWTSASLPATKLEGQQ